MNVNTLDVDRDPFITADGRTMYLMSTRTGSQAAPQPLTAVNTGAEESDPFVTADGCEFLFASSRPGGDGNLDIYRVRLGP